MFNDLPQILSPQALSMFRIADYNSVNSFIFKEFASRAMTPSPYVSTAEAALALGVGVSTVKRWVDEGILPAHRTGGGHRKLLRAEVLALVRDKSLPHDDVTGLRVTGCKETTPDAFRPLLLQSVLEGDAEQVRALLRRAYKAGFPFEKLGDQLIAPVMKQVGYDWEAGQIDVWQEHRGMQVCTAALHEMFAEAARRADRQRPVALGAGPEGDPYQLALLLGQLALIDAGWEAVNLGPNTPFASLAEAMRKLQPRLVWISASYLADDEKFVKEYRVFQREASRQGIPIALGGSALHEPLRSQLVYTTFGDGLTHLLEFALTLHPRPKLPRRGRPRRTEQ
jgi:excisionase family DNA binding protein